MRTVPTLTAIALALGVAAPLTVSSPALAQESTKIDANGDGMIDESEWNAYGDTFNEWDADGDGSVSTQEWDSGVNDAFGGTPGGGDDDGPLFGLLDTTDDNQLGEDEYFDDDSFAALDDNEDGMLDDQEFTL